MTGDVSRWLVGFAVMLGLGGAARADAASPPNIVLVLCDDLGYGDVQCLNPDGKIPTPHIDRLAREGMVFTDAHSSSSVCTPTRYGILTGRYHWRSRLQNGVLGGMSPRLIEPNRLTLPQLLQSRGYHAACVGKWHLGMDWTRKPDTTPFGDGIEKGEDGWRVDFSQAIRNGPTAVGFDQYFGISASLDMVPYTLISGERVVSVPTVDKAFPMMLGRSGRETRRGPAAADFQADQVLDALIDFSVDYVGRRADSARTGHPFFLYLPLASPHTPIVPTAAWQGRSGLNPYADFVMQTDAALGRLWSALEEHHLAHNTLVIFTSDNGCSPEADFPALRAKGHNPSYHFRGHKADIFEGGHRVPFIVRWPGHVQPGTASDQLVCLVDIMATCAELLNVTLPAHAGEDSISFLAALQGRAAAAPRDAIVHHSINGSFAIRQGPWKLCLCSDSGGWSEPRPTAQPSPDRPPVQLYNLSTDVGEQNNLQAEQPEIVNRLNQLLDEYVAQGRSTPGTPQKNAVPVKTRRGPQ